MSIAPAATDASAAAAAAPHAAAAPLLPATLEALFTREPAVMPTVGRMALGDCASVEDALAHVLTHRIALEEVELRRQRACEAMEDALPRLDAMTERDGTQLVRDVVALYHALFFSRVAQPSDLQVWAAGHLPNGADVLLAPDTGVLTLDLWTLRAVYSTPAWDAAFANGRVRCGGWRVHSVAHYVLFVVEHALVGRLMASLGVASVWPTEGGGPPPAPAGDNGTPAPPAVVAAMAGGVPLHSVPRGHPLLASLFGPHVPLRCGLFADHPAAWYLVAFNVFGHVTAKCELLPEDPSRRPLPPPAARPHARGADGRTGPGGLREALLLFDMAEHVRPEVAACQFLAAMALAPPQAVPCPATAAPSLRVTEAKGTPLSPPPPRLVHAVLHRVKAEWLDMRAQLPPPAAPAPATAPATAAATAPVVAATPPATGADKGGSASLPAAVRGAGEYKRVDGWLVNAGGERVTRPLPPDCHHACTQPHPAPGQPQPHPAPGQPQPHAQAQAPTQASLDVANDDPLADWSGNDDGVDADVLGSDDACWDPWMPAALSDVAPSQRVLHRWM